MVVSERQQLPLNRGLEAGLIKWTERPSTWTEGPTCSTYPYLLARNHLSGLHTHIDQVIDSTAGYVLLSFLDCYSGYHQIALNEEDQIKMAFITVNTTNDHFQAST